MRVLALGEPDPRCPPTFQPGTVYGNPGRAPSILELSEALPQPWRSPRTGVRPGSVTRYELNHDVGPPSVVHIHRPVTPGLGATAAPALAIVFDAKFWLSADITTTLDNLAADRDGPPLTTVMVESIHGASRHEGLTHADLFEPFLVDELLPWLRARWELGTGPIVLAGQSLGALTASWAARRHPQLFGHVVTSSMAAWWPGDGRGGLSGAEVVDAYRSADAAPVRFFLEVGSRERELLASVRTFRDVLIQRRYDVSLPGVRGRARHRVLARRSGRWPGRAPGSPIVHPRHLPFRPLAAIGQDGRMRWDRAVHHVAALARSCADMATNPVSSIRVTQLWAVGDILGPAADIEWRDDGAVRERCHRRMSPGGPSRAAPDTGLRPPGWPRTPSWPGGDLIRHRCGTIGSSGPRWCGTRPKANAATSWPP